MIDDVKFQKALAKYKRDFAQKQWPEEKYKWEAIKHFQDNWDEDAADFADMLKRSLAKTDNLLASWHNYPAQTIMTLAEKEPETVRRMFRDLFNEDDDVVRESKPSKKRLTL